MNERIRLFAKDFLFHEQFTSYGESIKEDRYEFYTDELQAFVELVRQDEREACEATQAENPTHTDHPLRHWDRTCPACIAELEEDSEPREWVGLTDQEICEAVGSPLDEVYLADFRKVEAKLKEKNRSAL